MAKQVPDTRSMVPIERVVRVILILRGRRVMIDADLAHLYAVPTRRLNEQVKRNRDRFPPDFMFRLSKAEKDEVVAKCDHLKNLKFSRALPNAFTEHGAVMLASVLNSPLAVSASIQIVRAFIRLQQILNSDQELRQKLDQLEAKYDHQFAAVFDAIRDLMDDRERRKRRKRIGFLTEVKTKKETGT